MNITETLEKLSGKSLVDCSNQELYLALLELVREPLLLPLLPRIRRILTLLL